MERRYYSRTKIGIESIFYINDTAVPSDDFTGVIDDMSEGGVRFIVKEDQYNNSVNEIKVGSVISFQGYDEYTLFRETKHTIFSGVVEVIRFEDNEDGKHYGCKIKNLSRDLETYIHNKKMAECERKGFRL